MSHDDGPGKNRLARMIHDGSSRTRRVTWQDRRAEPGGPDAYSCSTVRGHGAMKNERHVCARRRVDEAAGPEG